MTDPLLLELLRQRTPLHPRLLEGEAGSLIVHRRMQALGIADPAAYRERVAGDPVELEALVVAVAVPETWFFRYRTSFEFLAEWLRRRRQQAPNSILTVLSAPCATGQEPLSVVATAIHAGWPLDRIEIDAIDANAGAIAIAKASAVASLPVREPLPEWASNCFAAQDGGVVVRPEVLSRIRFAHADLLQWNPPDGRRYDVILCRNFLIYLSVEARHEMLRRCERWLAPHGLLLVGHADHDARSIEGFVNVGVPQTFAYERRREAAPAEAAPRRSTPAPRAVPPQPAPRRREPIARTLPTSKVASPVAPAAVQAASPALADARRLADQGRLEEAATIAGALAEQDDARIEGLELLGSVRLAQGRGDSARECFRRLVYLVPGHEAGLLQLALLSEQDGDHEAAERYRERARRAAAREAVE